MSNKKANNVVNSYPVGLKCYIAKWPLTVLNLQSTPTEEILLGSFVLTENLEISNDVLFLQLSIEKDNEIVHC